MKKLTQLQINCIAENKLNELSQSIYNQYLIHFRPLIGLNIWKSDGFLKEKYRIDLDVIKGEFSEMGLNFHFSVNSYFCGHNNCDLKINLCISCDGGTLYVNNYISLLSKDKIGLMDIVVSDRDFSIRYDWEKIKKDSEDVEIAKLNYNKIAEKIPYNFRDLLRIKTL